MPKQTMEQLRDHQGDVQAGLQQQRDKLSALADAVRQYHQTAIKELLAQHESLLARCPGADRKALGAALEQQQQLRDRQQSIQLQLVNMALDTAASLDRDTAAGARHATKLLEHAARLSQTIAAEVDREIAAGRERLSAAIGATHEDDRRAGIDEVVENQRDESERLDRDRQMAEQSIERRAALARNLLDGKDVAALRGAMRDAARTDEVRRLLTDEVVQRLADETRCPGRTVLNTINVDHAVQRVKGELAEQLASERARAAIAIENLARGADRQLFLVEGARIRDEQGRKLTDGLIVWRDRDDRLRVWQALEVKSGSTAARELNTRIERLTAGQEQELRRFARDLARDAVAAAQLSPQQRALEIERLAQVEEAKLRSPSAQRERGQKEQTTERLDLTTRIHIDGHSQEIAIDRERTLNEIVRKVTTDDAIRRDLDVERLRVQSRELEAIARAFVEELQRRLKNE
jgi:hypothetical protein